MTDESWRVSAACSGLGNLWDATIDDDHSESLADRNARLGAALLICRGCTVRNECYADATEGRDEGMRSGVMLPALGKPRPRVAGPGGYSQAPHGSSAAYRAHLRRGEKACDACRAWSSDDSARKRRAS